MVRSMPVRCPVKCLVLVFVGTSLQLDYGFVTVCPSVEGMRALFRRVARFESEKLSEGTVEIQSQAHVCASPLLYPCWPSYYCFRCPGIGRRFMAELCHSMKFSEPAQAYFGFQV